MTKYTDLAGNTITICDHCREDIPQGNAVLTVSPGIIKDNYVSKDYEKGELVLCPSCTRTVGQVLNLMGVKRADNMALLAAA